MSEARNFTGRTRRRTTRRSVRIVDRMARVLISVAGVGTILAVLGVSLFLIWVAAPLFLSARVEPVGSVEPDWQGNRP